MAESNLSAERLRELLHYDPETGVFTRAQDVRTGRNAAFVAAHKGDVAGTVNHTGHRIIILDKRRYRAHYLAWVYVHGEWPSGTVTHLNRTPDDNRIANLAVTAKEKRELTAQRLRELLDYDPDTGRFMRKTQRTKYGTQVPVQAWKAGRDAGHESDQGYRLVAVDGKAYRAHRLAWLYVHGEWPVQFLDHVNGDRSDNRIANLREVDNAGNMQNLKGARVDSQTGLLGVEVHAHGGYSARIKANGKRYYLGRFASADDAHAAYLKAKRKLHEGCTI